MYMSIKKIFCCLLVEGIQMMKDNMINKYFKLILKEIIYGN